MLLELVIENYAVIDQLRVRFHPGLNLLTGETGSGKSIVVDALALLLGGRASAEAVRSGEQRARISGLFEVPPEAQGILQASGFEAENGELAIEREVLANGKSRAFVGNRPATVALLRELSTFLGDIHGQHDQQLLFSRSEQLSMLDEFADAQELVDAAGGLYAQWRAVTKDLEERKRSGQETLRLLDLWAFQRKEIEDAAPRPGEDQTLEAERKILQNMERVMEAANAAYALLYDSHDSALSSVQQAGKRLDELVRIDPGAAEIRETLRPGEIAIQEASYVLQSYLSRLEANPGRLEEIESRLAALDKLKRKYGPALDDVLRFLEEVKSQIDRVEHSEERITELTREQTRLAGEFEVAAAKLSEGRRKAATDLARQVEGELKSLAMERSRLEIRVTRADWNETGFDAAEYLVSPNPGEELRPLDRVASGGEISRIALALKAALAAKGNQSKSRTRTLVFDEVDAGVGGSAAEGVGRRLKRLAAVNQVLCVTHLPQIAAFADHHFVVEKAEAGGRTRVTVDEQDRAGRVQEIGRMLSGQNLTTEAMKNAEQLLRAAAK